MRYQLPLILTLLLAPSAFAKNIDLSTVPRRDTVQLTIYNAEDLTLVRETRTITFKKGSNPLQFSWANTLIDPTSVQLEFKNKAEQLTLLDTTFPHGKPQMLYWNIASEFDGEATVQISYFTSGISWAADYVGIASPDETTMKLEGFVTVRNNSGEDYEDAQVRLVVGTINLVEQIAELARRGMGRPTPAPAQESELRQRVMRDALELAEADMAFGDAAPRADAKQIVKQGLSEYFIFTIEGTETIPHTWAKRLRSFEVEQAPVKIEYRYWPQQYGNQLVRMFLLTNDKEADLGTSPMPDGVYRLFRRNDGGGLSYLTQQSLKYIPIGDKIELNLGPDKEIVFELRELRTFRDAIWMKLHGVNVFREIGEGNVEIDVRSTVAGWDDHTVYSQRIRNYTADAITLDIRRVFGGHVEFKSKLAPSLHDYQTVQYRVTLDPGEKREALYEVVTKQGRNAKQNNVTLVDSEPAGVPWLE